ncbi:helical backbone metal receptor [Chryseomicrobium sp. FSL W7-1435]|uniref:ABC transporter substrate-binding protein n=1 Tax=Chryseomicrobium sp. FSL W7-1435 TaxID=2921704 RepID=UPI00315A2BD4
MKMFTDHLDRELLIPHCPQRIVSICPAITETLFALDVQKQLVGRTKYCIFPKIQVDRIPTVGGTKDVSLDKVRELKPDLILAEKEENTKETVELLSKIAPVIVLEVQTIEDSYRLIRDLGTVTGAPTAASQLEREARTAFDSLPNVSGNPSVLYMIWRKPYMAVGNTTYIQAMLEHMGFHNAAKSLEGRYPEITPELLEELNPDFLFLASEPFPFAEKHKQEFAQFTPTSQPVLVDGEMFWYGAKMPEAAQYLKELFENNESFRIDNTN